MGLRFCNPFPRAGCGSGVRRGILQNVSQAVFEAGEGCLDWQVLRPRIMAELAEDEGYVLRQAEVDCPDFDAFFDGFARADTVGRA